MNSRAHPARSVHFRALLGLLCATLAAACSDSSGPKASDARVSVSGVSPASGSTTGGTAVTVTGTSFPARVDSVRIGAGDLWNLFRVSATQLTGNTPAASAAGAVDVTVFGAGDTTATATCRGCFTYTSAVTVTSVSPSHGPQGGRTAITITGARFPLTVDSVLIGAGRLTNLVRVSATQLTGTTPVSSVSGSVDVTVWVGAAWGGSCAACFTYDATVVVTGVSPAAGPTAGGTALTITGMNFPATVDSVRVGTGRLANLVRVSAAQLTGTTPASSAPGRVDVAVYTASAGSDTCTGCFKYAAFARYAVTFLGVGFDSSRAVDMNDSGDVVGQVWTAASGWRGRLWPSAGIPVDLDVVLPVAVNNGRSVVGRFADADTVPALWDNGSTRTLNGLADSIGTTRAYATDIDDAGNVAVWTGGFPGQAYLWRAGSLTALGATSSLGRMNRRRQVAAGCTAFDFINYPFGSAACVLGTGTPVLLGAGAAWALNDSGRVIGEADYGGHGTPSGSEPFLFGYGRLPFYPAAINNSAQIVGGGSLWEDSVTASLSSLATDSAWQVSNAVAINERGQIAAYGVNNSAGQRGAVRLDPVATTSGSSAKRRR